MSCYKRCSQTARIYQAIHFFHRHLHRTHFWSCNCQQQQNISDVLTTPLPNKNTVPLTKWSAILLMTIQFSNNEYSYLFKSTTSWRLLISLNLNMWTAKKKKSPPSLLPPKNPTRGLFVHINTQRLLITTNNSNKTMTTEALASQAKRRTKPHLQCFEVQSDRFLCVSLFSLDVGQVVQGVCVCWAELQSGVVTVLSFLNLPKDTTAALSISGGHRSIPFDHSPIKVQKRLKLKALQKKWEKCTFGHFYHFMPNAFSPSQLSKSQICI